MTDVQHTSTPMAQCALHAGEARFECFVMRPSPLCSGHGGGVLVLRDHVEQSRQQSIARIDDLERRLRLQPTRN